MPEVIRNKAQALVISNKSPPTFSAYTANRGPNNPSPKNQQAEANSNSLWVTFNRIANNSVG